MTLFTVAAVDFSSAIDSFLAVVGKAFTFITTNELCLVYVGAGLLVLGICVFKKVKRSAK
ncbi:hypothetical protein RBG61_01455 [Paludicola sp. MB14-C6]|uniref:hypothetical protein n=1 Tax=Paludihabitans sp. MB14-C6 TaxID=3070656 RepID=UPI0027DB0F31|nr:hypothetical protein [Paludicola sp. MB14-C6]WMJ23356.1 hypothetical protein RBG61_01455 [Paludicola sp. MB14-C6]